MRTIALVAAVALGLAGAALARQVATRQRDYRALLERADAALRDDRTFAAIEAYSGAIALRPDSMLAYLRRGESYRKRADRGDLEAAGRDFRKAATIDRSATRPLEELGDVMYQLRRYDRAVDAYERFVRLDDRAARVTYKLALAHFRDGDIESALATVAQTVRLDDRMADAHYLRGLCLRQQGRNADAVHAFEAAVAISPALVPAREELADLFATLDRPRQQLEQLQILAGLDHDRLARPIAVARAYARAHQYDAAIVTLGSALERTADDPELYQALGQIWLESARTRDDRVDLSKAREALDRVASSPGATSRVLMLSGRAALEDEDVAAAERLLQDAVQQFPVEPAAFLLYATAAERQAHLDNARRALIQYEALIDEDRDFVAHATRIATLSARVDDVETAAEWTRRGLQKDSENAQLLALAKRLDDQRKAAKN